MNHRSRSARSPLGLLSLAALVAAGFGLRYRHLETEPLHWDEVEVYRNTIGFLEHGFPSIEVHPDAPRLRIHTSELLFVSTGLAALETIVREALGPSVLIQSTHEQLRYTFAGAFRSYLGQWLEWIEPLDEAREMDPVALGLLVIVDQFQLTAYVIQGPEISRALGVARGLIALLVSVVAAMLRRMLDERGSRPYPATLRCVHVA